MEKKKKRRGKTRKTGKKKEVEKEKKGWWWWCVRGLAVVVVVVGVVGVEEANEAIRCHKRTLKNRGMSRAGLFKKKYHRGERETARQKQSYDGKGRLSHRSKGSLLLSAAVLGGEKTISWITSLE